MSLLYYELSIFPGGRLECPTLSDNRVFTAISFFFVLKKFQILILEKKALRNTCAKKNAFGQLVERIYKCMWLSTKHNKLCINYDI